MRAEIYGILSRYGGASFREFDERISGGEFSETETFEDFTRLDYLGSSPGANPSMFF